MILRVIKLLLVVIAVVVAHPEIEKQEHISIDPHDVINNSDGYDFSFEGEEGISVNEFGGSQPENEKIDTSFIFDSEHISAEPAKVSSAFSYRTRRNGLDEADHTMAKNLHKIRHSAGGRRR